MENDLLPMVDSYWTTVSRQNLVMDVECETNQSRAIKRSYFLENAVHVSQKLDDYLATVVKSGLTSSK